MFGIFLHSDKCEIAYELVRRQEGGLFALSDGAQEKIRHMEFSLSEKTARFLSEKTAIPTEKFLHFSMIMQRKEPRNILEKIDYWEIAFYLEYWGYINNDGIWISDDTIARAQSVSREKKIPMKKLLQYHFSMSEDVAMYYNNGRLS